MIYENHAARLVHDDILLFFFLQMSRCNGSMLLVFRLVLKMVKLEVSGCLNTYSLTNRSGVSYTLCSYFISFPHITDWQRTSLEKSISFFRTSFLQSLLKYSKASIVPSAYICPVVSVFTFVHLSIICLFIYFGMSISTFLH